MDAAKSKEFKEGKQAILKRYNINEETYRQRFQNTKEEIDKSYVETEVRLKDPAAKRTKESLVNVIIREQLVNAMPKEMQLRVRERKPKTSDDAATLVDDIISARDSIFNVNDGVQKCLNCGKPDHVARNCIHIQGKMDGLESRELRDDRKQSDLPQKRETQLTCYNCGKIGHIASECSFPAKNGSGRYKAGNYFYGNTRNPSIGASVENTESKEREHMCQELVQGKPAKLLVDSGASFTLVHQTLVAPEKINTDDQLQFKCAHGDIAVYPTANVEINDIDGKLYRVRPGVSPSLPRHVVLGRDIDNLLELAVRELQAYAVLTRIQRRKKEKEEAAALAKEITSGVKPRLLTTESEEKNEKSVLLNRFDDSIFQGKSKQRKTTKNKNVQQRPYTTEEHKPSHQGRMMTIPRQKRNA